MTDPLTPPVRRGVPGWVVPVVACVSLAVGAVVGGAVVGIAASDDDDTATVVSTSPSTTSTTAPEDDETPTTSSSTTTITSTTTTTAPTTTTTAAPAEPIVQTGDGDGQTPPIQVPPGTYAVHYAFAGECYYSADMQKTDGSLDEIVDLGSGTGPVEGDTFAYNVTGGEYFIEMITGPSPGCPWEISLTPQG